MRIPLGESFSLLSCSFHLASTMRRYAGLTIHRSLVSSISCSFISSGLEALYTTLPPLSLSVKEVHNYSYSTSSHLHSQYKYQTTVCSFEPEEEVYAQQIRRVILKVHNGAVQDVVRSLQSDPSCCEIRLTSHLVDSLLQRFGDDWKSAMGFFEWADSHFGYKHTTYACNKMVDLLGKMKQIDPMWKLVHKMHCEGSLTLETIGKLMRRLAGARRWKDAISLFDDLESLGFDKDTESMNLLLDTLCKEKRIEVAREVFLVLKPHIVPNAYTFNIFVHGWCNARRIDEAMWTIQEMKGLGFQPSVITYSTMIQAYCNRFNFRKVYELLDEMAAVGSNPNVVTYTTVMNALAKSDKLEEALGIVERMKLSGCKPDTLFYNSLINILGRAGKLHEASQIFEEEMQMNGVSRNLSTYNTLISIFCHHHQEQNALNVLKEMENSSFKPDLQTYRPLLRLCFNVGGLDVHIDSLLNDITNKHHLSLDFDTYTLLIHGLCRVGNIERACLLFAEMIDQEILPGNQTYQMLLDVAEHRNMDAAVERINTLMKRIVVSP